MMSVLHRGKSTILQTFPAEDVVRWKERLSTPPPEVVELLSGVLGAATLHVQLETLRKLGKCVQGLPSDVDGLRDVICVLVEMHAACMSRHSVQRSLARSCMLKLTASDVAAVPLTACLVSAPLLTMQFSTAQAKSAIGFQPLAPEHWGRVSIAADLCILQGLPHSLHASVESCVIATVSKALCTHWLSDHMKRIQYIDAVVENFKTGKAAVQRAIPLVLEYCVSTLTSHCCLIKRQDTSVLTAVLKTTASLLQKFLAEVYQMQSVQESNSNSSKPDDSLLVWPQHVSGRTTHGKVQWVKEQLASVKESCEDILMKAADVPHDCAVSAAMLTVVLLLRESVDEDVDEKIGHFSQQWLTEGSPLQPFGCLTVVYALLAKVPAPHLVVVTFCGGPLLVALFPTICQLFNSFTETSDRYIASCTLSLWISVARDCVNGVSSDTQLYQSLLPTGEIMQTLLQYVWSLWEDPVDGIRHQCKEIFKSIIETYQQLQSGGSEDYLFSLVEVLLALKTPTRGKFILLSSLSQYVAVEQILQADPGLPEEIMTVMGHQALACHAGELWSRLTSLDWKICEDSNSWYKTWVDIAIKRMCETSPLARQHITQHCLPALFHCTSECMQYVNQQLQSERMTSVSGECKLITQLACWRCAKTECKQLDTSASFSATFNTAMHCSDVQIRLSALGLVCESHRTTEPLDASCLHLVLQFIELNANSQSPGFRYPAVNSLKKLLIRIRDSSYTLMKQHQKGRGETPTKYISSLQEFLQLLLTQQFEVLHPLSSFQRRNFALMILQLMAVIFESHPTNTAIPPIFNFCTGLSNSQAMSLLHALRDSYDANRVLYLDLLQVIPAEKLGLMDPVFLEHLVAVFFGLIESPKAVNCASAASMLKLLLHKVCSTFNVHLQAITKKVYGDVKSTDADHLKVKTGSLCIDEECPQWGTIHLLSGILYQHIYAAERDLLQASMKAPMYGVIQCIRVAFAEASTISPVSKVLDQYKSAISETVALCVRVAKVVSPVVCNSSPEGFLPDTKSLDKFGVSELLDEITPTTGNAQSLLLCCWHSMKEISLLLGYLAEHAPVETDQAESGVLTLEQLDVFANIFINQLTEARHRGAFEMAYTGFTKLCHCLWTSSCSALHQKPSCWVQELLESLQSTSLSRLLTITRRSAGLPFYLLSILTAEPSYTGRSCLKSTMKTLLKVAASCELPKAPTSADLQIAHPEIQPLPGVVHALNILRALYRDARLGDCIIPFVAEGVMLAIDGFSSTFWPVRNSSTLLFSALVARIFGAKRVSDEHSMENKLTAKEFFTRFPSLHGFLLEELITASQMLEKQSGKVLQSSLFPVLLLLSRLYPSALDEENSVTSLKPFLPLLIKCTSCPEWKTRVLISHSVVSTVSAHNLPSVIKDIVHQMNPHQHNELHGLLLIVYRLLIDRHELLKVPHSPGSTMDVGLWLLEQLLTKSLVTRCDITSALYYEVVIKLLEHAFRQERGCDLSEDAVCALAELARIAQTALYTHRNRTFFDDEFLVAQCQLLLLLAQYSDSQLSCEHQWPQVNEVISKSLQHSCPVVSLCALEYLSSKSLEAVEGFLPDVVKLVCDNVGSDQDVLAKAFFCLANVKGLLLAMADTQESGCSVLKKVLERAVDLSHQKFIRLELRVQLMHFVSVALVFNASEVPQWLSLLKESINPTQPVELRIAVSRSLLELWNVVYKTVDITVYCKLVMDLLQDADVDVREEMAESVAAIIAQANIPSSVGNSVHHPTAYSALKTFLESLFFLFPECNVQCFGILLDLISVDSEHVSERPTNPLFDEDPINNYREEARLVQIVGKCLEEFVVIHYADVAHQLEQLSERVALLFQLHLQELLCCCLELWEEPDKFLFLYKLLVLRKVLLSAPIESPHATSITTAVEQLREANKTLVFHSLLLNVL